MDAGVSAPPPSPPIERVRIERRGGFAGLRAGLDCAFGALTAAQQDAVRGLLATCGGSAPGPASPGADRFAFRLEVVHPNGAQRVVDVPEDAMPGPLAGLVKPRLP